MGQERVSERASRVTQAAAVLSLIVPFVVLSSAQAIELTSFRTPYAQLTTNNVGFSVSTDYFSRAVPDTSWASSLTYIRPGWNLFTKTASESREWFVSHNLSIDGELWHQLNRGGDFSFHRVRLREDLASGWRQYFGGTDLFASAALSAFVWPDFYGNGDTTVRGIEASGNGDLSLGVGCGRVRDAWPLAKAIRLLGILRDCGVLENEPREGPIIEVADFISRSWRLFRAHDRDAKYYYDSLETLLLGAQLITEPLPAYVLMKLDDGLMIGSDKREFGSRVFLGVEGAFDGKLDPFRPGRDTNPWRHISWTDLYLFPCLEYRFARPFGLRWTSGAGAKYLFYDISDTVHHSLKLELTGAYDLTNRLQVSADLNCDAAMRYGVRQPVSPAFSVSSDGSAGLGYYVADRLLLFASAGVRFFLPYPNRELPPHSRQSEVYFGFSLRTGPEWSHYWPAPQPVP
jgi:hypothetical protein